jgi:hypothetical protein
MRMSEKKKGSERRDRGRKGRKNEDRRGERRGTGRGGQR